jgi:dipeptidyl aminopeptidase/acylaminoacyl peptidase
MIKSTLYYYLVVLMSFATIQKNLADENLKEELFATPALISAKISPDGKTIAYVGADSSGISNLFITSSDEAFSNKVQTTFFTSPEIIQFFWSGDSRRVLLLRDQDGKGQLHLHGIDVQTKESVVYTGKFSSINAKLIQIGSTKNSAVIGLNDRNPHFHDLYTLDLDSGEFTLLFKNDQYAKFLVSEDLELILKMLINDDGSWTITTHDDAPFMELSPADAFQTEFLSYNAAQKAVYLLDNRFSDTNQLVVKSLSTQGIEKVLGAQSDSDIDQVLFIEGEPKAYASYYTEARWHPLDATVKEDITFLEKQFSVKQIGSNFELINMSRDGNVWILSNSLPEKGGQFWRYKRQGQELALLYSPSKSYSKMYSMVVEARDGKKLVCYYTLPKELDQGGTVASPVPLVVFPHGGPFKVRDKLEFNPYHQWLASCGYAVLSVNFRLSSGFGKGFVNAGNGEWGGKAHLDIIDAIEECIAKGITEPGKLAILGGSYGGYEALAGLTFTPDYFTCCVSICGPSNLKTVLDNVPQFWELTPKPLSDKLMFFTKRAFITSMGGDPDQLEGARYLQKCSPLNHLEGIQAPLMLVHGRNDHIVAERESKQIYDSMKKNGKKVTYLLFPDEGHRPAKFPNKVLFLDLAERFLSHHLGGRYSPATPGVVAKSSGQVFNQ